MSQQYRVEILQSDADVQRIAPEWLSLWRVDSRATPFQSPYWNLAWWRHLNPGGTLAVVTVRDRGELIGLAPWQCGGGMGRTLTFIGRGVSDYLDVVSRPHFRIQWLPEIARNIMRQLNCDGCDFDELSRRCGLMDDQDRGMSGVVEGGSICPVLQLPETVEQLDRAISPKASKSLGYYRRRLVRSHCCEIESANQRNLDYLLSELSRLHHEIWSARGQCGVLYGKGIADFHQDAALGLLHEGALRLYLLRIDGCSAAAFYGFCCHQRTYYYLGGFAPKFARLNPGTLLIGHAIEQAIHEGSREFNFLRGSEHYKYWWGAQDRVSYRVRLSNTSTNGD